MKRFQFRLLSVSLCLGICSAFLFAGVAFGQSCEQWGGKIVSVQGVVQVKKAGESKWMPVGLNATYCPGDTIRVLKNSRAAIVLSNETLFRLDQNTTVTFTGVEKEKTFLINILEGVTHFFSRQPRKLKVVTPFLNAAVEGTEFYVRVEQDQTFLSIFEGRVVASNKTGGLALTDGQSAVAKAGKEPVLRVVVRPRDAVQWALYYPPVLYVPPGVVPKEDMSDPRFLAYRASQLLAVGRVDEAGVDIERALSLDPTYSDAFALQSIIGVVQNEKDKALSAAQRAIDTGPNSATARLAMSYAQQANFDIQEALKSLQEAVKLSPENSMVWSRLAELFLSVGDLSKAAKAAQKSVDLNPSLAHTQTVLGFTYIDRFNIIKAKQTFNKAIELDSAAPLSRLGLGLAMIRGGDLKEGRAEIEIASGLDPNNSLIRSYLGKAYYDEKQDKLARDQFAVAKDLDPRDPTPWFYDAIRKQTINRPVEALHSMQKAIELNDNRGVYRSRLLLDQDLAARSAALGRIYNDLGFQQIGLLEGWKSLNADPSNYSAHRLLADSYSVLPRQEITRVSELLQSQLLQPLNITPVQPQLAETNLLMLEGAGPARPSFNEFNPLFLRNRLALQASGVVGNHDTKGDELTQSGVWGRYSYSLGQFYYDTDGFRENNDLNDKIYDAYAQVSLSPKASLQAEYRYRDVDHGDLSFSYDLDNPDETFRRDVRRKTFRAGARYSPSTHSDLIASLIHQDGRETESSVLTLERRPPLAPIEIPRKTRFKSDGYIAEGQYIFQQPLFNLISGGGHYDANNKRRFKISGRKSKIRFDTKHSNGYLYSHVHYPSPVTWTVGVSYDSFDDDLLGDTQRFNPKLGATFDLTEDTTFRLAYFKVLKRTLFADQTIEPTQVAGFNQFFDDINGTKSRRFGAAIDHSFSANFYGGLEYSRRKLRVPIISGDSVLKEDWDEDLIRAYLYWTVYRDLALSMEYQYEKFNRDIKSTGLSTPTNMNTQLLPATLGYFHPLGFFGQLRATYVHQKVETTEVENESDGFALLDAAVGYRFPQRYGILSFGVGNIFDKDFDFLGIESRTSDELASNPPFFPERTVLLRLTLSF